MERSFAVPLVGVDGGEGPPVPFPNTVVKLVCVENTWWVTAREDRQMPTLYDSAALKAAEFLYSSVAQSVVAPDC